MAARKTLKVLPSHSKDTCVICGKTGEQEFTDSGKQLVEGRIFISEQGYLFKICNSGHGPNYDSTPGAELLTDRNFLTDVANHARKELGLPVSPA